MDYIGVDLACSAQSRNPSAVAFLDPQGCLQETPRHFKQTKELVEVLSRYDSDELIIAVDAPRSVPDWSAENYAYRSCERGIKTVDPGAGTFSGAAALFIRWYEIETKYFQNVKVIETYPRVVWKQLGLPDKPKEFRKYRQEVWAAIEEKTGICCTGLTSGHQIDAILCAYTAFCYATGRAEGFGEPGEGLIFVPAVGDQCALPEGAERIDERFRRFPSMGSAPTPAAG
ncbi:MAG: hypothetical protein KAV82_10315 [Phycisphaerae bacterium]|nr:hypothetical protein [Phycisphaerae bacterium]